MPQGEDNMHFQLSSVVNVIGDVEKIVSLFMTYDGVTKSVTFNHNSLATPEDAKNTLGIAVGALLDAYVASKE